MQRIYLIQLLLQRQHRLHVLVLRLTPLLLGDLQAVELAEVGGGDGGEEEVEVALNVADVAFLEVGVAEVQGLEEGEMLNFLDVV